MFSRPALCATLGLLSGCASIPAINPQPDWVDYSAGVFAASAAEQQELLAAAAREHETEQSSDSALRLAVITLSLARSTAELREVIALTEYAAAADGGSNPSFITLLRSLAVGVLEREALLEQEHRDRLALQEQLDALRRLEQELNSQ